MRIFNVYLTGLLDYNCYVIFNGAFVAQKAAWVTAEFVLLWCLSDFDDDLNTGTSGFEVDLYLLLQSYTWQSGFSSLAIIGKQVWILEL